MAITTLAGILSGLTSPAQFGKGGSANVSGALAETYWAINGMIPSGSYDTTLNGVTLSGSTTNVTGQIPYKDPSSGNGYIAKVGIGLTGNTTGGTTEIVLADRLWHNGGISPTSTSAQTITSPTWPARDSAGATSGDGVLLAIEVSVGTAGGTTATVSYTNSAGTSGRSAAVTWGSAPASHSFWELPLQAGDTGVQSVQSITLSASMGSGTINLVAYRSIVTLVPLIQNKVSYWDAVQLGFPRIYNGTVLFIVVRGVQGNVTNNPIGTIIFAQG